MGKEQIIRTVYSKPEVEIMRIHMDCQLMEASFPGDHKKGNHKQGPQEESSEGAKKAFFTSEESTSISWEE